jgi:hypothetical protein
VQFSHLQGSDFDPQFLALRKLHPIVCKSEPSLPINGIRRLVRVSPTFRGFAAEFICFDVRHRAKAPQPRSSAAYDLRW